MDKICRKKDIRGNLFEYRLEGHDQLKNNPNPWIHYGFVSASKSRRTSDQLQIKDYSWIPKDSPYRIDDIL